MKRACHKTEKKLSIIDFTLEYVLSSQSIAPNVFMCYLYTYEYMCLRWWFRIRFKNACTFFIASISKWRKKQPKQSTQIENGFESGEHLIQLVTVTEKENQNEKCLVVLSFESWPDLNCLTHCLRRRVSSIWFVCIRLLLDPCLKNAHNVVLSLLSSMFHTINIYCSRVECSLAQFQSGIGHSKEK